MDKERQMKVFLGVFLVSIFNAFQQKKSSILVYQNFKKRFGDFLDFKWKFSRLYERSTFTSEELIFYLDSFIKRKWFDPFAYDHLQMRFQRKPSEGDFNWIFDDCILALASPISNIPFDPQTSFSSGQFVIF